MIESTSEADHNRQCEMAIKWIRRAEASVTSLRPYRGFAEKWQATTVTRNQVKMPSKEPSAWFTIIFLGLAIAVLAGSVITAFY
jgi:hypothetical protein